MRVFLEQMKANINVFKFILLVSTISVAIKGLQCISLNIMMINFFELSQ